MKQTAVEFLESQYNFHGELKKTDFEQAKEMFEEQIKDAFEKGFLTTQWDKTKENKAEQYYNETFKSE